MALNLISSYDSDDSSGASDRDESVHASDVEIPQSSEKPKSSSFFFGGDDGSDSDGNSEGSSKNADTINPNPTSGSVLLTISIEEAVAVTRMNYLRRNA
ncbi:hypothetical protein TELCIR_05530 [Teladorsagia circumcincta]|uniref:Uncharacterized protein n=1 Tax=Teladorsagia circumcincta TaxID=45464 RepID=A0A2G9UQG6_TELCI|nr:hypothetical protein TELCIR_05530 [Teladorsagia circumcincta]